VGIDCEIYVEAEVTDEFLSFAEEYMMKRVPSFAWRRDEGDTILRRRDYPEPRVEVQTLSRYYGTGYERGDWPDIYAAIRAMQGVFSDRPVFYGGDVSEYGMECTPEFLEEHWTHWQSAEGFGYRDRIRAWNEEHKGMGIYRG
jgi:hypothetical protein